MPSPPSPCIRSSIPPSFPPSSPLTETIITMSYDATSTSSPSPLSSSIVDDTSRPSSTRPKAGWGSPSPAPDSFPPVSLATVLTPIHSVTIPLYAHTLRDDFPDARCRDSYVSVLIFHLFYLSPDCLTVIHSLRTPY